MASYGRRGRGPGELEVPFRTALIGDTTLVVVDRATLRLSKFRRRDGLDSGVGLIFSNADSLFLFSPVGTLRRKVLIPVRHRRGTPADAEQRARMARTPEEVYSILSTAAAIQQLSDGTVAAVYLDFSLAGQRLTAVGWVSLIAADFASACVDAPLDLSTDAMPALAFSGDTLFALDQRVDQSTARTIVRAWLLDSTECRWLPSVASPLN